MDEIDSRRRQCLAPRFWWVLAPSPTEQGLREEIANRLVLEGETIDILLCKAGARLCALRLGNVIETMRVLPIQAVEGILPCVSGLSLIRGKPCPVLDLSKLLGCQEEPSRLVLLRVPGEGAERQVALAVSSVEGVSTTSARALIEMPPLLSSASAATVEAVTVYDSQLMTILQTGSLLSKEDWAALESR